MPYANPEDRRRNSREYYLKNREKKLSYAKGYRDIHREQIHEYRKSPEGQEYHRKKAREFYRQHRDRYVEYSRTYRAKHPEKGNRYREENREKIREQKRAWRARNRERDKDNQQRYKKLHPEYYKFINECYRAKVDKRCKEDAGYYAEIRAKARVNYAKRRIRIGKPYSPNVARRIPDTVCKSILYKVLPNGLSTTESIVNIGYGMAMNSARYPKK